MCVYDLAKSDCEQGASANPNALEAMRRSSQELRRAPHERVIAVLGGEHDMVEECYAEELPGLGEAPRDLAILGARARIPARVRVQDDEGDRATEEGRLEDLARMDERLVGGSDGDDLVSDRPVACVEVDRKEVLARVVPHHLARNLDRELWPEDAALVPYACASVLHADLAKEGGTVISIVFHVAFSRLRGDPAGRRFTGHERWTRGRSTGAGVDGSERGERRERRSSGGRGG